MKSYVEVRDRQQAMATLVAARLKDEGYQIFSGHVDDVMPAFLQTFRPDLIALKSGRDLAIDIKERRAARHGRPDASERARIAERLFEHHPDWEYQLVSVPPANLDPELPATDRARLEERLARIETLLSAAEPEMALVHAWATLEAAARWRWPDRLAFPQMPARLVELLAYEGYLMPKEQQLLRAVQKLRTRVAHGDLTAMVTSEDVRTVIQAVRLLLDHAPANAAE